MKNLNYEYYRDVLKNAKFTKEKCQICSSEENCLEGIYFEQGSQLKSVCLNCLNEGKIKVDIPTYLRDKLYESIKNNDINKDKKAIELKANKLIEKLEKTPPVPWIQSNDWPVCCGDFLKFIGEWEQENFNEKAENGIGKEKFEALLDENTRKKIDNIDMVWEDLESETVAFVFRCNHCNKYIVVCQSY